MTPEPDTRFTPTRYGSTKTIADLRAERDSAIFDRQVLYAQLQRVRADLNDALATIDDLRNDIIALRVSRLTPAPEMQK